MKVLSQACLIPTDEMSCTHSNLSAKYAVFAFQFRLSFLLCQVVVVLSGSMEPGLSRRHPVPAHGLSPMRTGEIVVFDIDDRVVPIVQGPSGCVASVTRGDVFESNRDERRLVRFPVGANWQDCGLQHQKQRRPNCASRHSGLELGVQLVNAVQKFTTRPWSSGSKTWDVLIVHLHISLINLFLNKIG